MTAEIETQESETIAPHSPLRYGWTTGTCATAATKAAYSALVTGVFPESISVTLPRGETPCFMLSYQAYGSEEACAGVIKDAGDDPDVTHGAMVLSTVRFGLSGRGVVFRAGPGVGIVTKAGLPLEVGSPAINPVPQQMIRLAISEIATLYNVSQDVEVTLSIPDGDKLALKTWNPRLGIIGGLSILGTTGIVVPYSCSAWIHAIHRGVDVARAAGLVHLGAATGKTSERALQNRYCLPDHALIDMGDFVGGFLKYLRRHPVSRVTIAGGFGKMTKLGQGYLDLHSRRSSVSIDWLARRAMTMCSASIMDGDQLRLLSSAGEVLAFVTEKHIPLASAVAYAARTTVDEVLRDCDIATEVLVVDRSGTIIGQTSS